MKTKSLWTLCLYSGFWEKTRRNAKRCPRCGARFGRGTHPTREFATNPNPQTDPKTADSPLAL